MARIASKASFVAVAALVTAAAVAGCSGIGSSEESPAHNPDTYANYGDTAFEITLGDGQIVTVVNYTVTGPGGFTYSDTIDVSNAQSTVSVELGLQAGTGYQISMSAITDQGSDCLGGPVTFDVIAGSSSTIGINLSCDPLNDGNNVGGTDVNGTFVPGDPATCRDVQTYVVSPLVQGPGGIITLKSTATTTPRPANFSWTSTGPAPASATTADTTITCPPGGFGPFQVTITITDDDVCVDAETIDVSCVAPPNCGTNGVEPALGEECDPPGSQVPGAPVGVLCTGDCQIPAYCGDGVVDAPAEQCDGSAPAGSTCSATCQLITNCGNGALDVGEACDPGSPGAACPTAGDTCSAACACIPPSNPCGNGIFEPALGEECEPPNTAFCDSACHFGGACTTCEVAANGGDPSVHTNCSSALCLNAIQCARVNNCYQLSQADCYCGAGVDVVACQGGSAVAVGPCKPQYDAAAGVPGAPGDQGTVLNSLGDPGTEIGKAGFMQLIDQAFCQVECFP